MVHAQSQVKDDKRGQDSCEDKLIKEFHKFIEAAQETEEQLLAQTQQIQQECAARLADHSTIDLPKQVHAMMHGMYADVVEVCPPPRMTKYVEESGPKVGWNSDITACDENGQAWDFSRHEMSMNAKNTLLKDKPLLLIGFPMCTNLMCHEHELGQHVTRGSE